MTSLKHLLYQLPRVSGSDTRFDGSCMPLLIRVARCSYFKQPRIVSIRQVEPAQLAAYPVQALQSSFWPRVTVRFSTRAVSLNGNATSGRSDELTFASKSPLYLPRLSLLTNFKSHTIVPSKVLSDGTPLLHFPSLDVLWIWSTCPMKAIPYHFYTFHWHHRT